MVVGYRPDRLAVSMRLVFGIVWVGIINKQLCRIVLRCAVILHMTAFFASVGNDEPAASIRAHSRRTHNAAAAAGTVARVNIKMKRAKTERTVIAGGVPKRDDLPTAGCANEAAVFFCKKGVGHKKPPKRKNLQIVVYFYLSVYYNT